MTQLSDPTGSTSRSAESAGPDAPATRLRKVALLIAYDGSPFQGWQVQPQGPTVQGRLEKALRIITRAPVTVYGSGRTDSGVHALNQVAHALVPDTLELSKLQASLNGLAGPAIAIKAARWVPDDFHARHSALSKTYRYHLFNRPYPPVLGRQRCWWLRQPLDAGAMRRAAEPLLGEHDFSSFRAKECEAASPVRQLFALRLEEGDWTDATLRLELHASGFLQHMARIITGTLVAAGLGKLSPRDVAAILTGRRRELAAATAPPEGLHMLQVQYDLQRYPQLRDFTAL